VKRLVVALAACGDNHVVLDARPDAPNKPDLVLLGDMMKDTIEITTAAFAPTDCEVLEACVELPGVRRLLRFDTVTANLGDADLVVGVPPAPGVSDDLFTWSPCHGHHHVTGYASYTVRGGAIALGRKQSFCLHDVQAIEPTSGNNYDCTKQGISAGWADVYPRSLPCQFIDITDLPSGTYTLEVEVNAARKLVESDTSNNVWMTDVSL
jgi:hypothetical protein